MLGGRAIGGGVGHAFVDHVVVGSCGDPWWIAGVSLVGSLAPSLWGSVWGSVLLGLWGIIERRYG